MHVHEYTMKWRRVNLHSFQGYLKWRSTLFESEDSSKRTIRFAIQWHNMAIRPSITQALATAI